MRYIVTGGAGFIGSHITDVLIREGHEVVIIDNMETGKEQNINPKAEFHKVDIRDKAALPELFKDAVGVFHCAALARIQPSFEAPEESFDVNAGGTRNVLEAAKANKVKRVIYSASSSAYGERDDMPLRESDKVPSQAGHPYGSTKRMGEMLMRDMGTMTGGPETVCLRYFNVFGPRQNTSLDGPYPTVIGVFLDLAKEGKPLTVVPDGYQERDFTYVDDVVAANLAAMRSDKVGGGEILNIGAGAKYSIWDVARIVLGVDRSTTPEALIKSGKCMYAPPRRNEVRATLADTTMAKELLGWEAKTAFEDGMKRSQEALHKKA